MRHLPVEMIKSRKPSTNDIVQLYSKNRRKAKLTIRKLDKDTVLIEGSATALQFLGQYLIAHAQAGRLDCGVQLSPKGPGNAWFAKDATLGIYLHRLPCYQSRK